MTTDLDPTLRDRLTAGTDHLAMDAPIEQVMARGGRLRRRRHAALSGALAVGAVAVTATTVGLPTDDGALVPRADAAAWGAHAVDVAAEPLDAASRACEQETLPDGTAVVPPGAKLVAAESRSGETMVVYRAGDKAVLCTLDDGSARPRVNGWTDPAWTRLSAGSDPELAFLKGATAQPGAPSTDVLGAAWVPASAAVAHLEVAGQTYEAMLVEGLALFWLADGLSDTELDATTVTAYDSDGNQVSTGPLVG